jgi:hypothetical protein
MKYTGENTTKYPLTWVIEIKNEYLNPIWKKK